MENNPFLMNKISDLIKSAERSLEQENIWFEVDFKDLEWTKDKFGKWRIMCGDRPLIEHKFQDRLEHVSALGNLVAIARQMAAERTRGILKDMEKALEIINGTTNQTAGGKDE